MIDTFLALLVVAVVLAVHGVIKLLLMPFRLLRGLFSGTGPSRPR